MAEKSPGDTKCIQTAKNFAKFPRKGASSDLKPSTTDLKLSTVAEAFQVPHSTAVNRKARYARHWGSAIGALEKVLAFMRASCS